MPRFTFRQLEYLVAVGDTGSIARASENLNVSSPSISSAISQLEEELGISLFVRQHAQGLSTTKGGCRVIDQAKRVLKEAATTWQAFHFADEKLEDQYKESVALRGLQPARRI